MQSAPPEVLQTATSVDQPQLPSLPTQHGLPHDEQQASRGTLSRSSLREPNPNLEDTSDNVSVSSGGTQRGRSSNAGRLSRQHSSSQEGSPGSRIDEYERAFTKYRRSSDELMFQVVPSTKDKAQQVSIESFPNGESRFVHSIHSFH
jgi:hypothetical protein